MKIHVVLCASILLLPATVLAASPFDGTWKASLDQTKISKKSVAIAISNGSYTCSTCVPAVSVTADGADHPVTGHDYDTVAVTVIGPNQVTIAQKVKGKAFDSLKETVSADGKVLTGEDTYWGAAQPAVYKSISKRVGPAAPGAHAVSGTWVITKIESVTEAALFETLSMTDEEFKWSSNGQSYAARFDGKKYPVAGDPTQMSVELKRVNASEVVETDYVHGKLAVTEQMTVSADGKTMELLQTSARDGRVDRFHLVKQP